MALLSLAVAEKRYSRSSLAGHGEARHLAEGIVLPSLGLRAAAGEVVPTHLGKLT